MKNLAMRIDIEAGRLLAMKWTKRNEVRAGSLQGEHASNDIYDITGSANLFQRRWRNESGHMIACPLRSAFIKQILHQTFAGAHRGTFAQVFLFRNGWPNQERRKICSSHEARQRFFKH